MPPSEGLRSCHRISFSLIFLTPRLNENLINIQLIKMDKNAGTKTKNPNKNIKL